MPVELKKKSSARFFTLADNRRKIHPAQLMKKYAVLGII